MKSLRLLAVCGSPRKNGNSSVYLEDTLKALDRICFLVEVTRFDFAGKNFGPCTGCLVCYKNGGNCIVKDDYEELKQLWLSADIVLYAFPVYHLGVPGQMKCFFDRLGNSLFGYYDTGSVRHMKVVACLAQGGVSMGGQEIANLAVMQHAALLNNFYVSADGAHVGSGAVSGEGGNKDSFREKGKTADPAYLRSVKEAQNMLQRMIETAEILRTGLLALKNELDSGYTHCIHRMEDKGE